MKVVLDTSVLIYWTLDPEKLTQPAAFAIENAEQIIVSAISIWERVCFISVKNLV